MTPPEEGTTPPDGGEGTAPAPKLLRVRRSADATNATNATDAAHPAPSGAPLPMDAERRKRLPSPILRGTSLRDHREQATPGPLAQATLFCGVASWVPWVIVLTAPLAVVFFVGALVQSRRLGLPRATLAPAMFGLGLTAAAAALHVSIAFLASVPGLIGEVIDWFRAGL